MGYLYPGIISLPLPFFRHSVQFPKGYFEDWMNHDFLLFRTFQRSALVRSQKGHCPWGHSHRSAMGPTEHRALWGPSGACDGDGTGDGRPAGLAAQFEARCTEWVSFVNSRGTKKNIFFKIVYLWVWYNFCWGFDQKYIMRKCFSCRWESMCLIRFSP